MKKFSESFCTSCEWHGDGDGIVGCPVCGAPITALDPETSLEEEEPEFPESALDEEDPDQI